MSITRTDVRNEKQLKVSTGSSSTQFYELGKYPYGQLHLASLAYVINERKWKVRLGNKFQVAWKEFRSISDNLHIYSWVQYLLNVPESECTNIYFL